MKLTNTQYNFIMQEYQQLQQDRKDLIRERRLELRKRIPGFAELDDEFVTKGREALISSLGSGGVKPDYGALTDSVRQQEKRLMQQNGYPDDYLDPPYECSDCHDTGYVDGHECHCFRKRVVEMLYKDEPVMQRLLTDHFADFDINRYPTDMMDRQAGASARQCAEDALRGSRHYVENFDKDHKSIVFYGSPGSGKTFLSSCIAGELMRSGHTVVYLSAVRLFEVMSDHSFNKISASDDAGYSSIFSADLLIIDDLGTELCNTFTSSALFDVINSRGLNNMATIISTNLGLSGIREKYTDRIYSRLIEKYLFFHLFGFDSRYETRLIELDPARKNGGN